MGNRWPDLHPDPEARPQTNREAWLELLGGGTLRYAAQPYQQLAAAYRAEGHDSDVRAILIAQSAATRSPAAGLERPANEDQRSRRVVGLVGQR